MNLKGRIAKVEQRRFGRTAAHLTDAERDALTRQAYLESLSDEELDAQIEELRAMLVAAGFDPISLTLEALQADGIAA